MTNKEAKRILQFCICVPMKTDMQREAFNLAIKALEERPQGEWIDHSEDYGYAECPFCHELTNCEGNIDELHYCWNCGAKLGRGGV